MSCLLCVAPAPPGGDRFACDLFPSFRGELVGAGLATLYPTLATGRDGGGIFAVINGFGGFFIRRRIREGGG